MFGKHNLVYCLQFTVYGLILVYCLQFTVYGLRFTVYFEGIQDSGFRIQDSGFRIQDSRFMFFRPETELLFKEIINLLIALLKFMLSS